MIAAIYARKSTERRTTTMEKQGTRRRARYGDGTLYQRGTTC
jgi:hypothetical protein